MSATPGPWGLTTTYPEGQWVLYSKTATGPGEKQSRDVGRFIGAEVDARLIAAAPDLLGALEIIADVLANPVRPGHVAYKSKADLIAIADRAIAKARGNHP